MKSIRFVITVAFLSIILFLSISLLTLFQLSYREISTELSTYVSNTLAERTSDQLINMVNLPVELNRVEADAINLGLLDFNNAQKVNQYFWQNLRAYPILNAAFYANSNGDMFGSRHSPNDDAVFEVMQSNYLKGGNLQYFSTDSQGKPLSVVEQATNYDPRSRSWYTDAVQAGHTRWSPIYLDFATQALVITAASPIYDVDGNLIGVIGSAFKFSEVHEYLQPLKIGKSGIIFLIERNGLLISTSTDDPFYKQTGNSIDRINAMDSQNTLIKTATAFINQNYKGFGNIYDQEIFSFIISGKKYFGYVVPITDPNGIDWLSVTIIPESDFLFPVQIYNRSILVLIVLTVLIAIILALLISKRYTDPIMRLTNVAREYSEGNWAASIDTGRKDELGILARSLFHMEEKVKNLISDLNKQYDKLHETHEFLEKLISSANVMIVGLDQNGRVRLSNKVVETITGYTQNELIGIYWFEKIVPRDRFPEVWEIFNKYIQNEQGIPLNFENPILTKFGEERFISWQNSVISFPDKSVYTISFGIDITEHKKTEEELTLLSFATNHAREAVFLIDKDARLLYVNNEVCHILGYSKDELQAMCVSDIDPDFTLEYLLKNLQILKSAQSLIVESRFRTKSGKVFPVEMRQNYFKYAEKEYIFVSAHDISERIRTLEEVKAVSLYNRSLIEAGLDPLIIIGRNGTITDVNKATEEITGYTRKTLIGTDFCNYFSEPHEARTGYQQAFKLGFVRDYPLQIKNKDGKFIPVLYNATTFKDNKGRVVGVFASARDITERLQAEIKLHTSVERDQMAQAIGHVGNWEYNIQTAEFWGSDEAKRIYGFNVEQDSFTAEEVESCIPGRDWVHQALVDLIEKGKPYDLKFEIYPKHSTESKIITSVAELQKDQNGNPLKIVGVIQDITTREKLQERSNRLAEIVEFSNDAIIGKTLEGIITSWNKGAVRIYGYTEAEVIGKHISILLPEGNEDDMTSMLNRVKLGEHVDHYETQRCRKDGKCIFISLTISPIFDTTGKVIAASTIARDITERKLNEAINNARMHLTQYAVSHSLKEVLEETINQAENLTDSLIGFLHFIADDQENLILQTWSTRTKNEFCKAEGEGLHYPIKQAGVWVECFYARKPIIHNYYAILPNRKGMPEGHAEVIREMVVPVVRGGKITAILGVGNKLDDYDKNDVDAVSCIADMAWEIVDRKRAEENIQQLNRQLEDRVIERTSQLEAANNELEAFAYSVSHDLRAPLRHIDGFLELLHMRADESLNDESKHYMDIISDSAKRMGMLIDDLLSFSRMSRFEMAKMQVNLDELVKEVIKDFESDTKGRRIKWEILDLPFVIGDRSMLRIVFVNLISNALKFARPRKITRIEVGLEPGSKGEDIIFVRDNGIGFDMNYADKLFGVFQRLHNVDEFKGTGIGLATTRRIISRHGGRTWAEGKEGQGATFYFSLPRDE